MEESKYHNLINKRLSGEITKTEESELQNWLNESEQNLEMFNQVSNLWKVTKPLSEPDFPNVDEEWLKLSKNLRINGESKTARVIQLEKKEIHQPVVSHKMVWSRYLAAAAILIVILGFSFWTVYRSAPNFMVIETRNAETRQINLEDGSVVKLNSASKLIYLSSFTDSVRYLKLQGEAFFDVVSETRPFIVETQNAKIRVLGTEFNIWSRREETRVIVKEGRVSLLSKNPDQTKGVLLKKDQMGVFQNQQISDPINITSSENMLGWLEGRIVFSQTNLKEVVEELNRIYDLTIQLESSSLENLSITGNFEKKPIEEVLEAICLTLDLRFKQDVSNYIVY